MQDYVTSNIIIKPLQLHCQEFLLIKEFDKNLIYQTSNIKSLESLDTVTKSIIKEKNALALIDNPT